MKRKEIRKRLFPESLWTGRFLLWWIVALLLQLSFDLMWMGQTTFRPMSTLPFYPWTLAAATFLSFPALFTRRGWVNTVWLLFIALVMLSNLMYCRTYFNAIPLRSYLLVGNLADFTASVTDSFRWYFIALFIIPLGGWVLSGFLPPWEKKPNLPAYFILLGLLICLGLLSDSWRGGPLKRIGEMKESAYGAAGVVPVYTLGGFLANDYLESTARLSDAQRENIDKWLSRQSQFTRLKNIATEDSLFRPKKNLVLILCESLENWPVGLVIEGKEITPYINSLLKDSTTFYAPHIVSQVGNGRSIDAQLLILAGMIPMRHGVYAYDTVEDNYLTLPKAIKEKGGRAYLLTCDKPYVWNESLVAEAFGIDTLIHSASFEIKETAGPSRRLSDGSFMTQSVEKLKKGEIWPVDERAFIMWVTYSGHNPFDLPEKLRKIELKGDYPEIIRNYMITANYTDSALWILIEYLRSRPDWEDTMVVITGDHEGLASDRRAALDNPLSAEFVDPSPHTPLIVVNSPVGGRFNREAGEIDIYPTLLDMLGLDDYSWKGMGVSLLSPEHPGIAIGSGDEIYGDVSEVDSLRLDHVKKARDISDMILRYNLLRP